jgi:hypothetical protein
MSVTLSSINTFLRSVVSLCVLSLIGVASWFGYQTVSSRTTLETQLRQQSAQVEKLEQDLAARQIQMAQLEKDLAEQAKRIQELDLANRLLKLNHRLARISVLNQWESKEKSHPMTEIMFVDVDDEGNPIDEPRKFTIEGDVVYIDSWVIKYLDKLIEAGDPLRGTSVCLLRRLWGEYQQPKDGYSLDPVNSRPIAYDRGSQMPDFEKEIWKNFWDYANDPKKAEAAGIRAAHGDAPSIKLRPGKSYIFELRSTGEPTLRPEEDVFRDRGSL